MSCEKCGRHANGRFCADCRLEESLESGCVPDDFDVCEGCGNSRRGVILERFPDGNKFELCADCRELGSRMWAQWALEKPDAAHKVRAEANAQLADANKAGGESA